MKKLHALGMMLTLLVLQACSQIPKDVEPVTNFTLESYLGTWYEIARLDHSFEEGLQQVTANYSLRSDGGVKVINRGFDTRKQRWNEAIGKAYFVGENNVGQLKVSFFGPFYGGYNIIALDDDYQHVMVCGPDLSYLWILARSPKLNEGILKGLVEQANNLGFATDELIYVKHE